MCKCCAINSINLGGRRVSTSSDLGGCLSKNVRRGVQIKSLQRLNLEATHTVGADSPTRGTSGESLCGVMVVW